MYASSIPSVKRPILLFYGGYIYYYFGLGQTIPPPHMPIGVYTCHCGFDIAGIQFTLDMPMPDNSQSIKKSDSWMRINAKAI